MKKSTLLVLLVALPGLAISGAAFAGKPEADACAAKLEGEAKLIYEATSPLVQPGTDLKAVVTEAVTNLVMGGNIAKDTAETNAKKAGPCLQKLM